jgi:hypothetical protein
MGTVAPCVIPDSSSRDVDGWTTVFQTNGARSDGEVVAAHVVVRLHTSAAPQADYRLYEDRYIHEDYLFQQRLSQYLTAQAFLSIAATTALVNAPGRGNLPIAVGLTIEAVGLCLTLVYRYVLMQQVRFLSDLRAFRPTHPKYAEVRDVHMAGRARRKRYALMFRQSVKDVLSRGVSLLFLFMWLAFVAITFAFK